MSIIDQVKERLSIFKNLYDVIRVIDPISKQIVYINENEIDISLQSCYCFWNNIAECENCTSIRAYLENDTFVKIEYRQGSVFLLISTPVVIDEQTYIVEIIKDISQKGYLKDENAITMKTTEKMISEMNSRIITDELTGIYNRRYINERLPVDINNSVTMHKPISVIMADIDLFKNINDKFGHIIGDKVLLSFAKLISSSIRNDTDWVGRFGGEEFIIVLNNTKALDAYKIAESIRMSLESSEFNYGDCKINITSSFGISSLSNTEISAETLISAADKNLYAAKKLGRNKTVLNTESK